MFGVTKYLCELNFLQELWSREAFFSPAEGYDVWVVGVWLLVLFVLFFWLWTLKY